MQPKKGQYRPAVSWTENSTTTPMEELMKQNELPYTSQSMNIVLHLERVMDRAGIKSQRQLIDKISEYNPNIRLRPITVSGLYNNKAKHLPIELIHGICAVTNSQPGDWMSFEYNETPPHYIKNYKLE